MGLCQFHSRAWAFRRGCSALFFAAGRKGLPNLTFNTMNKKLPFHLTILALGLVFLFPGAGCAGKEERTKKAVLIIIDGVSADVLERVETPHLDEMIGEGNYTRAYVGGKRGGYSESPTISAPGYNHILTGTWSNKHNVRDNDINDPNYNYWNIFRLIKHRHPKKRTAIYSSWLDNRTKLAGHDLPEAGNVSIDIHYDGFELDTAAFPHEEGYVQRIDEHVSRKAAESIRKQGPDLSWVYLWYPDSAGHDHGETEVMFDAIRAADRQVGRIWEAVRHRMEHYHEEWLVIVTTDHGRRLPDGRGHGGQSARERTIWIVTSIPGTNRYFSEARPGAVDIYPTISRFMGIDLPAGLEKELDGVPLIGEVSISSPAASFQSESRRIALSWEAWNEEGHVSIWVSPTNHFAEGEQDRYEKLAEVPVAARKAEVDVSSMPSGFYKVVMKAPWNTVNRWVWPED
jgi:hypothetical protein